MRRFRVVLGCLAALVVVGVATVLVLGPERLLARAGYAAVDTRLVTGLVVTGAAGSPVVYVTSSDPRIPDYVQREHLPIDTNSGVVSVLERASEGWARRDLVQGLPRSRHDHAPNGMAFDAERNRLYVAQGSMTNMGAPSMRFQGPEYALSGAILSLDIDELESGTFALPTLDDETRAGAEDAGDPFGGNGGRNQAIVSESGPVALYATGFRNPYDLVLTRRGMLFATDNGSNWFWGGPPRLLNGACTNRIEEGGRYVADSLLLVEEDGYYGHPNPTRSSSAVTFNESNPQSPVGRPRPEECLFRRERPGNAVTSFDTSTNGLAEYTASSFGGRMSGDLVAASFDRRIYRVDLDASGRNVLRQVPLTEVDGYPLDVTTQSDQVPFPGTIWVADWLTGDLIVLEPRDRLQYAHWESLTGSGFARQEVSWVRAGNRFFLAGGDRRHEAYDPATDTWIEVSPLPERLDHIQGVEVDGLLYYVGGLSAYPEPAVGSVWIYDPATDSFSRGAAMPRPRGAGGVAVHDGKIYYAGGLSDGRAVAWLDVYDPQTDSWSALPDMPRPRDHFQAQVVGSRFYAIGGRDSDVGAITPANDAYDLSLERWVEGLAPLPTPRGGYASAVVGDEILVFGGESEDRAFAEVEAYDVGTDTWHALEPMSAPRHGIQAIACAGDVYIAAGGTAPFGDAPSNVNSVYVGRPSDRCPLVADRSKRTQPTGFRTARVPTGLANPTSLQFGPDGRLYVAEQDGTIAVLTMHRSDDGEYALDAVERIEAVRAIPNHDDDGSPMASWEALARKVGDKLGLCCAAGEGALETVAPGTVPPRGDPERGRTLFRDAGCVGCHTFAPAGSTALTGPPLDARRGLPLEYLVQSIVEPDAIVVPGYPPGQMPSDYGSTLDRQQLADVVAFVRFGRRER